MQHKSQNACTGFTLVHYDITVPTGTVMLNRTNDLGEVGSKLPPKNLVSDGRKQVIDPSVLQPAYTKRKQVLRLLDEQGTPFFGGHLIPPQNIEFTAAELVRLEAEYESLIDDIAQRLDKEQADWAQKHPAWAQLFSENQLTEVEFRKRCGFKVAMMEIMSPDNPNAAKAFSKAAATIVPTFLAELAQRASKAWDTHAHGKGRMTQNGLQAVKDIVARLKAFALLDPRVGPSTQGYDAVLAAMPKTGPLNPRETAQAHALLSHLMQPERILDHGNAVLEATPGAFLPEAEAADETVPTPTPAPNAAPTIPSKDIARCGTEANAVTSTVTPDPPATQASAVVPVPALTASSQDWSGSF